jgi:RimJ/RimL family protein N-acetyltransferase
VTVRETVRLVLRPWEAADARRLVEIFADPGVTEFPWGRPLVPSEVLNLLADWLRHWETQGFGLWAAVDRASSEVIGPVGLSLPMFLPEVLPTPEVGWRLHPDWWGKGLATEAATAALDYGFDELHLDRIVSAPQPANERSCRVAERLGMRLVDRAMHATRQLAVLVYEITAEEWRERRADVT